MKGVGGGGGAEVERGLWVGRGGYDVSGIWRVRVKGGEEMGLGGGGGGGYDVSEV